MNTQNTPVHIKLWHRDFWLMAIASLLETMAVYVLIPVMPDWLMTEENLTPQEVGLSMGAFGVGLYMLGTFCSWLIQRYRRNMVCIYAMLGMIVSAGVLLYVDNLRVSFVDLWVILLQRLTLGAFFGLSQMVLSSTLIIDTCESFQRTEANYSASWFSRFAMSLGPMTGLLVYHAIGFREVVLFSIGLVVVAVLLVRMVAFPFRTPDEMVRIISSDRFFLPHAFPLFANLVLICAVFGLVLSLPHETIFYALMMGGFLLALLAQRFIFQNAELMSEVLSGLIMLGASLMILLIYPDSPVAPILMGLGLGIISSRFLLFFIKLSRHCRRGTSQSTYFLGLETGVIMGFSAGYLLFYQESAKLLYTALALTLGSMMCYYFFTHQWFMRNKNR